MCSMDMNIPNTRRRTATSRRGGMRSEAAAAAVIMPGGAVVASAMICTAQARAHREVPELSWVNHRCGIEIDFAVGIGRALAGINRRIYRHAGAQQVLISHLLWHPDTNRKPLDDLGEVAGGVIRRQQREHRSGRR